MPKIDPAKAQVVRGSRYPAPHDEPCQGRESIRLSDVAALTQFGVNLLTLKPGVWSSQRHWHAKEDEFVYVLDGDVVLVTDEGEDLLRAGDSAGFKAGEKNGHCLQNRSSRDAHILIVGGRDDEDYGEYSDIDMQFLPGRYSGGGGYAKKSNGERLK
jgi:uncharacterized cupin superfamily protein